MFHELLLSQIDIPDFGLHKLFYEHKDSANKNV